jgi:RimJ/RimL family protein N-acetyltransferase
MNINDPLFVAENICLGPIDAEKDAEIEAGWTNDANFVRMISLDPAMPQPAAVIKKRYEAIEKAQEEKRNQFYFTIRMRTDDRLIGYGKIERIVWSNGTGYVQLGIGDPNERRKGYGSEALRLLLRFAFDELNLYRLSALIPEYNAAGQGLALKFGFSEEVRRRGALERDGRRWDLLHFGLLADEWQAKTRAASG